MPPQDSFVCLCVCGVYKGLDSAGKDLSILGRCTRSKLCYMIVSASQMMMFSLTAQNWRRGVVKGRKIFVKNRACL